MNLKRKKSLVIFTILLLGIVCFEVLRGPRSVFSGFDRGVDARYQRIPISHDKRAVLSELGEPQKIGKELLLPQRRGFEVLFHQAEGSSAVEYYQWINGVNWYYCIGFDSAGRVAIKGEGHS